ncbi:hypothetical protein [Williamsia sterculiae]|uniref:Uncharacterized protein n=1 Tax=Williamsia sterculiae TaxID=1344003 RepID=A0A1N7FCY3_9NOCA|nr:hypothetical protein [Williamsia sterculiae]SIR98207.1 hypothetical protein SAMN05445060_1945 [Williamsia sterculiae]
MTAAQIKYWCQTSSVPADRVVVNGVAQRELTDAAAVAIASGHLSDDARAIVVRRLTHSLPVPALDGGFGQLRRLQRTIGQTEQQLDNPMMPGVVATVVRSRLNGLLRRREELRKVVTSAKGVHASSIRSIRRERRDGVHLEMADRDRLFAGLLLTPTPNVAGTGYVRRAGVLAMDRLAGAVGQLASRAGSTRVDQWVGELTGEPVGAQPTTPSGEARFIDGYETILFLAGSLYDRIQASPAWHSEHFEMQRLQLNLHRELADIATDVLALRSVRVDLDSARRSGGFDRGFAEHIDSREMALRPVWAQLIERVQALSDVAAVVDSATTELRLLDEFARAATIDDRIDRLVGRSGDREMSADNAKRLSEQVRFGESQLRVYRDVLNGNISRLESHTRPQLPRQ